MLTPGTAEQPADVNHAMLSLIVRLVTFAPLICGVSVPKTTGGGSVTVKLPELSNVKTLLNTPDVLVAVASWQVSVTV